MSDELPNAFFGLPSNLIGLESAPEFLVEYGWDSEHGVNNQPGNEKAMYASLWDVAYAHGRAFGQIEAGKAAQEKLNAKHDRIENLETQLARVQDDAKNKAQAEAEGLWGPKVRDLEELLQTERGRCEHAVTALEITAKRVEELKDLLKTERAERKIGFRIWWRLNSLAAAAFRASSGKVASYTAD